MQTGVNPPSAATPSRAIRTRRLAVAAALVYFISLAFPVIAGLARDTASFPKWFGVLDVAIAFVLAIMAFWIGGLAGRDINKQAEEATYRAYRFLTHGIFVMLVVFFLAGDRITWINCLTGFAWRAWLLLYSLPAWFTALRATESKLQPHL